MDSETSKRVWKKDKWKWFQTDFVPASEAQIQAMIKESGRPEEEVRKLYADLANDTIVVNAKYQVNIRRRPSEIPGEPGLVHLSIKRRDKWVIRDWRDLQRIKNELVGPQYEAVELFPAEERLVDTSNQYHLWVVDDPTYRFPFGWNERLVFDKSGKFASGARQRGIEK